LTTIMSIVGLALGLTLMLLSVMAMRGVEGPAPALTVTPVVGEAWCEAPDRVVCVDPSTMRRER